MIIPAHPLQWPAGWKRTPAGRRSSAKFGKQRTVQSSYVQSDGSRHSYKRKGQVTIAEGVDRVRSELAKMGVDADDLVINSNLRLRLDGLPRSDQREPADPGIAVYWRAGGETRCMAIDRYDRVADNLAAIAATLEAMRAIERHGGAAILDRAFTGFAALPGPASIDWREVLGLGSQFRGSLADAAVAYRRLRSSRHPDHGGTPEAFQQLQAAIEQARQELEP